jgi:hypothetical protein
LDSIETHHITEWDWTEQLTNFEVHVAFSLQGKNRPSGGQYTPFVPCRLFVGYDWSGGPKSDPLTTIKLPPAVLNSGFAETENIDHSEEMVGRLYAVETSCFKLHVKKIVLPSESPESSVTDLVLSVVPHV